MDVDLRKLRYFVAVAEHLHFGRAAKALHIAQPVLSGQIKVLEDDLKAPLFARDKRSTELTAAGVQLLADARPLLANAPVVVMPGLVYGHSGGLTQSFFVEPGRAAGAVPCIGDGSNHWTLVHVDDLAELYVLALNAPAGCIYAGVSGQSLPLADITQALSQAAGCPGRINSLTLEEAIQQIGPSPRHSPSTSNSPAPGPAANSAGHPPISMP